MERGQKLNSTVFGGVTGGGTTGCDGALLLLSVSLVFLDISGSYEFLDASEFQQALRVVEGAFAGMMTGVDKGDIESRFCK